MDKNLENRFGYLNELDLDSLLKERDNAVSELNFLLKTIEDKNESSFKRSEFSESDLKYERDKITYIEYLIQKKKENSSEFTR